jgi:hypothetical protein
MSKTCQGAYRDALLRRSKIPLRKGDYKLAESIITIEKMRDTLEAIERGIRSNCFGRDEPLGNCMSYERGYWMKRLPSQISYEIGYNLVPARRLLAGDPALTERDLIDQCESVRLWLSRGIAHEYKAIRQGRPRLSPLIASVLYVPHRSNLMAT